MMTQEPQTWFYINYSQHVHTSADCIATSKQNIESFDFFEKDTPKSMYILISLLKSPLVYKIIEGEEVNRRKAPFPYTVLCKGKKKLYKEKKTSKIFK